MTGAVAFYMRLSSEDGQAGESCSIGNQRDLLYNFIRERQEFAGCTVMEFSDDGYSGVNFDRPGLGRLLALAGSAVGCIIVKDFSRFGRNMVEVADYLDQIFPFLGVRFISVNDGYDSSKHFGRTAGLDVSLNAMLHEMYSRDVSEKILSVKRAKTKKGEYLCGIAFYGYKRSKTEKNQLEIDEPAAEVVQRIFSMASEGIRTSEIARRLNGEGVPSPLMYRRLNHTDSGRGWNTAGDRLCWTWGIVKRLITDERYTGRLVAYKRVRADVSSKRTKPVPPEDWIVAENAHEAVVPEELFEKAQAVVKHRKKKTMRSEPYQKFHGVLKCSYCGRVLGQKPAQKAFFYCHTGRAVPDGECAGIYLFEKSLEESLLRAIRERADTAALQVNAGEKKDSREESLKRELKESQKMVARYRAMQKENFEDYAEERIDKNEYLRRKQEAGSHLKESEQQTAELLKELEMAGQEERDCPLDIGMTDAESGELTREMLETYIREIRVSGKDLLEIVWK